MTKSEISFVPELLRDKQYSLILNEFRLRAFHSSRFIGYQRDPHASVVIPDVDLKLNLRPIQKSDYGKLLYFNRQTSPTEIKNILIRKTWLMSGLETCYVTETENKIPCHMQWMIGPQENSKLLKFTGGGLPALDDDEVLLENAFTMEAYRRKRIEVWTVKHLMEKAAASGVKRAILFVRDTNTVTHKIVQGLGFAPYLTKTDSRFLFFRKIDFQPYQGDAVKSTKGSLP